MFKLSSFSTLALVFTLSSLDVVIGQIDTSDVTQLYRRDHPNTLFKYRDARSPHLWVFCYLHASFWRFLNIKFDSTSCSRQIRSMVVDKKTCYVSCVYFKIYQWFITEKSQAAVKPNVGDAGNVCDQWLTLFVVTSIFQIQIMQVKAIAKGWSQLLPNPSPEILLVVLQYRF